MDSNIKGIDISNNNGTVNFSAVSADSVKYVYVKATEGETFQDNYMDAFYNGCKKYGLKVGAYHFLVGTSSPEAQARSFFNKIKNYKWDLMPMLDVESSFSGLSNYVQRFITTFKSICKLELGIYSYTSFISKLDTIKDTLKDMPFWEANYNNNPWSLNDNFFINRIGHQYTETGNVSGIKTKCDLNIFTEEILIGDWIETSKGWWYKYTDGTYPTHEWFKINGSWYYFDYNGYMLTGWIQDNGIDYYTYSTGKMATNWVQLDGNWYYFDKSGAMKTDWQQIDGNWYYLNKNGIMAKYWVLLDSYWYYLNSNGVMVLGWQQINDNFYYFYSDGKMAVSTVTPDGYTVDGDGAWDSSIPKK